MTRREVAAVILAALAGAVIGAGLAGPAMARAARDQADQAWQEALDRADHDDGLRPGYPDEVRP